MNSSNNVMRHQHRDLSEEKKRQVLEIKDLGSAFIHLLNRLQDTREINISRERIEEAVMWAVKGITK
jgi:hypothetical protein